MHDTILLNKISESVKEICKTNNIKKVENLIVDVNHKINVNEENLYEHLQYVGDGLIGLWTTINVKRDDIPDQTTFIHSIQGEQGEE